MNWFELSENVLLLRTPRNHQLADQILKLRIDSVLDVVSTENELAIEHSSTDILDLISRIEEIDIDESNRDTEVQEIPVCYELGLDWQQLETHSGLSKEDIISLLEKETFQASYGFTPGFLYLSGLPEILHCPRRESPRNRVDPGSVGIGGDKTGIYSLDSPGGWHILGRTPLKLFDPNLEPPVPVGAATSIRFIRISLEEFQSWET